MFFCPFQQCCNWKFRKKTGHIGTSSGSFLGIAKLYNWRLFCNMLMFRNKVARHHLMRDSALPQQLEDCWTSSSIPSSLSHFFHPRRASQDKDDQ